MLRPAWSLSAPLFACIFCVLGCEPASRTGESAVNVSADGVPSCCEEAPPSVADARKAAMMKDAAAKDASAKDAKLPSAPTLLDSKEAQDAKAAADKKIESGKNTTTDGASKETSAGLAPVDQRSKLSMDFTMTDQEGRSVSLTTLKGKPVVATFIFTRCGDPNMCPLQGVKMANLQKQLDKAGLSDKVNLVVFTFDPNYDTPARLKEWGRQQGIVNTNARLLRPDPREFSDFQYVFRFRAGPTPDGQITHKTDMMMIDHEGRLAAVYQGMWDDAMALAHVKELIAEVK